MQDEAWPGVNAKHRPLVRYSTTVERSRSTASAEQHRLLKERQRCHHVHLNEVEAIMGRKEQRERERKKTALNALTACKNALSGLGFLPKKR